MTSTARTLTAGIGVAAAGADLAVDLGPLHPAGHAGFRIELTVGADDVIESAEARIGYMHRGAEKLFEVRDYPSILALANRHDWLAAFSGELGVALAVEELLGIAVPERAVWLRTLLAELGRASSHLAFASGLPGIDPAAAWRARELPQQLLTAATGGHLHQMAVAIGGLRRDVDAAWLDDVTATTGRLRSELAGLLAGVDLGPAQGLARLPADTAVALGVSGVNARASGVALDVRLAEPYLAYAELAAAGVLRLQLGAAGDAAARFALLVEELGTTLDLVDECAARLHGIAGPVDVRLPKVIRAPEAMTTCWTETPLGAASWLLVSTGDKVPARLKLKAPSFATLQALTYVLPGTTLSQLPLALRSLLFVVGDADR